MLVALEPYRPLLTLLTLGLLGAGFYTTYRRPAAVLPTQAGQGDDCGCEMPKANKSGRRLLWIATGFVGVALLFPYVTPYLF